MMEFVEQGHVDKINEYLEQLEDCGEQDSGEYMRLRELRDIFVVGLEEQQHNPGYRMFVRDWVAKIYTVSPWYDYEPDMYEDVNSLFGWAQ